MDMLFGQARMAYDTRGKGEFAFYKREGQTRSDEHKTFLLYATRSICLPFRLKHWYSARHWLRDEMDISNASASSEIGDPLVCMYVVVIYQILNLIVIFSKEAGGVGRPRPFPADFTSEIAGAGSPYTYKWA
jgi:hypothetical protein